MVWSLSQADMSTNFGNLRLFIDIFTGTLAEFFELMCFNCAVCPGGFKAVSAQAPERVPTALLNCLKGGVEPPDRSHNGVC